MNLLQFLILVFHGAARFGNIFYYDSSSRNLYIVGNVDIPDYFCTHSNHDVVTKGWWDMLTGASVANAVVAVKMNILTPFAICNNTASEMIDEQSFSDIFGLKFNTKFFTKTVTS